MVKKARSTRELTNIFPEWSRVRSDDQSVGFQLFNAIGYSMDTMDEYLEIMKKNQYIGTANIDEVDQIWNIQLPTDFSFSTTSIDEIGINYTPPTVEGLAWLDAELIVSGYTPVTISEDNDLKTFWYKALPTRLIVDYIASGYSDLLIDQLAISFPFDSIENSGTLKHHLYELDGGYLWLEAKSGVQYINTNELDGSLDRAEVIIRGITKKGTEENERLIFPWNIKQRTTKEWKEVTRVEPYQFEDSTTLTVKSSEFNNPEYMDFFNLRYSDDRTKIDDFWSLGNTGYTLERVNYIATKWQDLLLGFTDKETKRHWNLLDENGQAISFADLAVQPFTNRAWFATSDGYIYCYNLEEEGFTNIDLIKDSNPNSNLDLVFEDRYLTSFDDINFIPTYVNPLQEIDKYRIWYQDPNGDKFGLLNGTTVSYSSDFYVYQPQVKRALEPLVNLTPNLMGEYLFCIEATYVDNTTDIKKVLVSVNYKTPLAYLNTGLSNIDGIDFDGDQRLWLRDTNSYYHRIKFFYDNMLIDYTNKIIYLRDSYIDVRVTP